MLATISRVCLQSIFSAMDRLLGDCARISRIDPALARDAKWKDIWSDLHEAQEKLGKYLKAEAAERRKAGKQHQCSNKRSREDIRR